MGKRSNFERRERDFYPTPIDPVPYLIPHLEPETKFYEPFGGNGALIGHVCSYGHVCVGASDIEPQESQYRISKKNVFDLEKKHVSKAELLISNSVWPAPGQRGEPTTGMIVHLSNLKPTWLLLAADFKHNKYFSQKVEDRCRKIVSAGRVKWVPGSKYTGKENCAWYLFDQPSEQRPVFYGRAA
ncbi:MAG: class I SAM-dependent methyltransferase [Sneathiella sp.]